MGVSNVGLVARILVAEDDRNTNDVICDFLTDAGFDVVPVYDGRQAAMEDEQTQVISFDRLADDYITKPFSLILLVKRVKALLRRSGAMDDSVLTFGGVTIDFAGYSVTNQDGPVDLSAKEIELIKYLYRHRGQAMARHQILEAVWGIDFLSSDRKIDTHIKNIRKKLGYDCIVTVRGLGYKFEVQG